MELTLVRWPFEIVVRTARPEPDDRESGARLERLYHRLQVQREAEQRLLDARQRVFWRCLGHF
jgi:hypothetical protein